MKKIGLVFKETSEKQIKAGLKGAGSVFVIGYLGLSSPDLTQLRQSLRKTNSDMLVVKNSVARRAFKECGFESLVALVEGPCGIVFAKDEPVAASKALYDFAKAHENLKLEGGAFKDKILVKQDIESMAKLPSREVLRVAVVMTLKSPIRGLVIVLNQTLRKFVYCLEQIKNKKTGEK